MGWNGSAISSADWIADSQFRAETAWYRSLGNYRVSGLAGHWNRYSDHLSLKQNAYIYPRAVFVFVTNAISTGTTE